MTSTPRFVLDTNIIVSSAFFPQGLQRKILNIAGQQGKILASEMTFAELTNVMLRSRFDRFASLADREIVLEDFAHIAEFITIREPIVACRDPKDDKYLELAVYGEADYLITGDADLLALHPFRGIPILTARSFIELFKD
jgi:uncharacterized protein